MSCYDNKNRMQKPVMTSAVTIPIHTLVIPTTGSILMAHDAQERLQPKEIMESVELELLTIQKLPEFGC